MTNLLKHLNTNFCTELNVAWLTYVSALKIKGADPSIYETLYALLKEAREQGYRFQIEYAPDLFIQECKAENEVALFLRTHPKWKETEVIIKMMKLGRENQWTFLEPYLENLKNEYLKTLLKEFATRHARQYGPFFAGSDHAVIHVLGLLDSVKEEIMLHSFVHRHG